MEQKDQVQSLSLREVTDEDEFSQTLLALFRGANVGAIRSFRLGNGNNPQIHIQLLENAASDNGCKN